MPRVVAAASCLTVASVMTGTVIGIAGTVTMGIVGAYVAGASLKRERRGLLSAPAAAAVATGATAGCTAAPNAAGVP